jgi:hypothetical protein
MARHPPSHYLGVRICALRRQIYTVLIRVRLWRGVEENTLDDIFVGSYGGPQCR